MRSHPLDMAPPKTPNTPRGTMKGTSSQQVVSFTVRAAPLPAALLEFILANIEVWKVLLHVRAMQQGQKAREEEEDEVDISGGVVRKPTVTPEQFWDAFEAKCKEVGGEWRDIADRLWAFGPNKAGGCLLIDSRDSKYPVSYVLPPRAASDIFHVHSLQPKTSPATSKVG